MTNYIDDGYHRTLDGGDYFDLVKKYISGSQTTWTIEGVSQLTNMSNVQCLYDSNANTAANTGTFIYHSSSQMFLNVSNGITMVQLGSGGDNGVTANNWFHWIARRNGATFDISISSTPVENPTNFAAARTGTSVNAGTMTDDTNFPRIGSLSGSPNFQVIGKIAWIRISKVARYQ